MAPRKQSVQKRRNFRKLYREKEWTFNDLVKYFDGNRVDAAAQVFDKTVRYCMRESSRYPLTPLSSPVSSPVRQRAPLLSETDPWILGKQTPTLPENMPEIRCNKCHRYMDGSPDPSLTHEESPGDARCTLEHHPHPCEYKSSKFGDCSFYPAKDGAINGELAKKFSQLDAKSDALEGNLAKVASEMERVVLMLGKLTYKPPDPSGTLATAPVPPQIVTDTGFQPQAAALPKGAAGEHGALTDLANQLINTNQKTAAAATTTVPGYTGLTMPELRKDQDLASLVRSELGRILSQTPSLQKAPDAGVNSNQSREQQQQQQQQQQQALREQQQALAGQQLLKFQEAQQQQLNKFAADQKAQFEVFQQQLGIQVPNPSIPSFPPQQNLPAAVPYTQIPQLPTQTAAGRDHPAYEALGGHQGLQSDQPHAGALAMDMETLLGLTVRSKQYRPFEFARRTQLFYASNITEKNCNLPCYVLGYLRHCLILMSGVVPSSENEVASRLTNLMNICEIAANNSTLSDFDCPGWQIGKTYGDRVFHDMETGRRSWEELPAHILPDIFLHAKDTVAMKNVKNSKKDPEDPKKKGKKKFEGNKACSTYNTFRTGEGCAYEWSNTDKKCEFEHYCKKCFQKTGKKERHKSLNCDVEVDSTKKDE